MGGSSKQSLYLTQLPKRDSPRARWGQTSLCLPHILGRRQSLEAEQQEEIIKSLDRSGGVVVDVTAEQQAQLLRTLVTPHSEGLGHTTTACCWGSPQTLKLEDPLLDVSELPLSLWSRLI